jgi:thiol-disulfide isomerase/thioredoxin
MKISRLIFLLVFTTTLLPQEKCKLVFDENSGKQMLIGEITRNSFKDTSFAWWFDAEYDNYNPDKQVLDSIAQKIKDVDITIVLGTWCSDSRREVPRFFKILDSLRYLSNKVKMIAVDRNKEDLNGEVDSLAIELVPTFIFYREGKEIGRIEESPKETLEKDFNKIVWKE